MNPNIAEAPPIAQSSPQPPFAPLAYAPSFEHLEEDEAETTQEIIETTQEIIETMRKVTRSTTDERMPDMPFAPDDRVSIRLKSGATLAHDPVVMPKGSWSKPLTEALLKSGGTGIAYETIQVNNRLPLLEPMSEVAGRM